MKNKKNVMYEDSDYQRDLLFYNESFIEEKNDALLTDYPSNENE